MQRIAVLVVSLLQRREGQDLMEYALIAALIATVAILTMRAVGVELNALLWEPIAAAI